MERDDWGEALARGFVAGDGKAVKKVRELISRIAAHPRGFFIPRDQQEDIVQIVVVNLVEAVPRTGFVFRNGFEALVRHVTHARCVDWVRRRRDTIPLEDAPPLRARSDEQRILEEDRYRLLSAVLDRLGEGCARLIRMHAVEELTYEEIAARLGRSAGGLRVKMCHCIKEARRIREELERAGPKEVRA